MGQIVNRGNVKAVVNLQAIQTVAQNSNLTQDGSKASTVLANGEIWLIDTTNSKSGNGDGKYDSYIVGNGNSVASALTILEINEKIIVDNSVTQGSTNAVSGGAVYSAILAIDVSSQISGKADKNEMSVVPGTGANADKTTITLKSGTSATVLTQHQDISGKQDTISNVTVAVDANTGTPAGTVSFSDNTLSFSFQNLKGAKGDTGSQGPQGPQGERGPEGPAGITGDVSSLNIIQSIDNTTDYASTDVAGAKALQEVSKSTADYFIICRKENFSGWGYGGYSTGTTDYPLTAGVTYELIWDNSATIYFRWWDENNTQNTPLNNRAVTGPFIYEFTPEVNVVKWNVSSSVTNTFTIRVKNLNRNVLLKDDIVNDLTRGGKDIPLSAEQGKVLNESISVLNQQSVPLNQGAINAAGYLSSTLVDAHGVLFNSGFSTLRVKAGYEYILYGANISEYNNTSLTTLVSTYTSEPYVNNTTLPYFWINVKKINGDNISIDELFDIVIIENDESAYNFKTLNKVNDYYKLGKQFLIEGYDIVEGEGWSDQGYVTTSSSYNRTGYINVNDIDALKIYISTIYDDIRYNTRIMCKWFDSEYNAVGHSKYTGIRKENICVIGVPKYAHYVSVYCVQYDINNIKIYGFKHSNSITDAHYYNEQVNPIAKLARVSLILMYGQSLSVGSDAEAITLKQNYSALRMLNGNTPSALGDKSFYSLNALSTLNAEDPSYGVGEKFVEAIQEENGVSVYANEWERHYIVLASCGSGQKNITQLTDDALYANVEKAITNTKNLCDEFGFTLEIPAWCWFQGEQDMKAQPNDGVAAISTPNEYKEALLALHEKICASITTITGSTKRPKCAIYQPASQCLYTQTYNFANSYLAFNNAYVDLLKNNEEFIAVAPVYIFDPSPNNAGFIHLSARSYKTLGAYAGYSIKKALIDRVKVKGVIPIDITVDGTTISIKYNVPCPPLKFDTEWVKEPPLTNGVHNYGFNVVKSDDTELITNVSVFDDTVTIECSESPIGAKLRYGLNGDVYHYPGSNYNGADGRIHGGRGNLRDSQGDYVQKEIKELNQTMRLDNWAYCFEELLTEPEGE